MKTLIAIGTALCLALALSAAHNLDEADAQQVVNQKQVKQEQSALARFEKAAQSICGGENADWHIDGITVTCSTKRGFITQKVAIK